MHSFPIRAVLAVAVFLAFGNCLANELIGDARSIFRENRFYKDPRHFTQIFTKDFVMDPGRMDAGAVGEEPFSGCISYRPVTALSFFADAFLWREKASGYHLTNILLHLLAVWLAFALMIRLRVPLEMAFWAGLIFAVHPVQSEAVDGIGYRSDLLCAVFFLTAFLSYLNYASFRQKRWLGTAALGFAAALLSKETAVIFPLLIVVYDLIYTPHEEIKDRSFAYGSFFAVLVGFLVLYFLIFPSVYYPQFINRGISDLDHILLMVVIFAQYLQTLIFPWTVKILPPLYAPPLTEFPYGEVFLVSFFIFVLILSAVATFRRAPFVTFAAVWFLATYLPASNLMPLPNPLAYRFLYLPSVGFAIIMAFWLTQAGIFLSRKTGSAHVSLIIRAGFVVLCIISAVTSNFYFRNNITACRAMIRDFPDSSRPYWILGLEYLERKEYQEAVGYFKRYLATDPNNPFINDVKRDFLAHVMLGRSYVFLDAALAVQELKAALALNPQFIVPYLELSRFYILRNDFTQALDYARQAIAVRPDNPLGYVYVVHCLTELGRFDEAENNLRKAEVLRPKDENVIFVRQFLDVKRKP